MARTGGGEPGAMKANKTPKRQHKKAKSSGRLGQGSRHERTVRPDKAQPNGARKTKKSRRSHSKWSDNAGIFDMTDSDDDRLSSMEEKKREISRNRTLPAVKRSRNGSTGGGGSQQVSAPAFDNEAGQPPTTSAAGTRRKRKPEGEGESSGGRQRRRRAAQNEAAGAAAASAPSTSSTTSTTGTRGTRRTTSGSGSGDDSGGDSSSVTSPPASTTTTPPPSTASPADVPVTREDVIERIREQLTPEQRIEWDATTGGESWSPSQGPIEDEDVRGQDDISTRKTRLTGRKVPTHAAGVGNVVFRHGVLWDRLTCKILAFPVNSHHFMGGPEEWEGTNAAVVWKNNCYWLGANGELIDGQCCTAHYLGQVMQRCGLDHVFVCDASGVAHPRSGSGLKKGNPGTRNLITAHVEYLLGSGRRILEVHSRGTSLRFLEVLEEMATAGHADTSIKVGSGKVRVHVFFGVPCGPNGALDTVVLVCTDHHSMMRFSFVANSIIRSQIVASSLAGNALTKGQVDDLWAMSTTGSLTPEEWKEYYADLLDELGEEVLAKFEKLVVKKGGDMDRAYQSLIAWKGGMAAPTTKARRGGEWETALGEMSEEAARLEAKPRTRGNAKAVGKVASDKQEVSSKLEAQYRRWESSVGAMHFGNAANYDAWMKAKKTIADGNATKANKEEATAVVAKLEQEKKERLSAQGAASSGTDCNQVGAGPNENRAAKKRKNIPVDAGDDGAEETSRISASKPLKELGLCLGLSADGVGLVAKLQTCIDLTTGAILADPALWCDKPKFVDVKLGPRGFTLRDSTWQEDDTGCLVLGYHNGNNRGGTTPRCVASTIPVVKVGEDWLVPEWALGYIRAGKVVQRDTNNKRHKGAPEKARAKKREARK